MARSSQLPRSYPLTATTTSPALSPDRAAGLPFATSATVMLPAAERSSQAPAQADDMAPSPHDDRPAADALVWLPQCAPPANAGTATTSARTAAADPIILFMFP